MHKSIREYMQWRGDLPFKQVEFGEVDALIFAWLIYYTMEDLKEKGVSVIGMTVQQVAQAHLEWIGPLKQVDPMKKPFPVENAELLLEEAADTDRFGNAVVEDFVAINGKMSGAQFAVGSFLLDDGRRVISYRGTDTTVAGWKENCRMAYEENVPAQLLASAYMEKLTDGKETIVCGHSKGGNLAMYAALKCRPATEKVICRVYNFDSPGFCFDWKNTPNYQKLKDRIVTIVPEASIVGALLNHDENYIVVKSEMSGFLQHNSYCWHVHRSQFVRAQSRTKVSLAVEKTMQEWLKELTYAERREAVQMLFGVVEDMGIVDFRELMDDTARKGMQLLKGMVNWDPKQKQRVGRLISDLLQECGYSVPASMVERLLIKGEKID